MPACKNRISGWLALDKPQGISSARAVALVRRIFNAAKAGHAGTLDPMASGLLPIALGEATKTAFYLTKTRKTYDFIVRFGISTDSFDAEGQTIAVSAQRPTDSQIKKHLGDFIGAIDQIPPVFSAIKENGQPAYKRARAGEVFDLPPRRVEIDDLRLLDRPDPDHAHMEMRCGPGVYVRALARDLGAKLGCPAHIAQLRRTRVGNFSAQDMIILDKIKEIGHSESIGDHQKLNDLLQPLEIALDGLPQLAILPDQAGRLRQGQSIILKQGGDIASDQPILVCAQGYAVALARFENGRLKPHRVFNA